MPTDGDFLQAVLHDLHGPLGRIKMLGDLLLRRAASLDEDTRLLIAHIGASASSAEGVLEALQRYADAACRPFEARRFDLTLAVVAAVGRVQEQLRGSGGQVAHNVLPEVSGDPAQLEILFQELIANAVEFRSAEAPRIAIAAALPEADWWTIAITDNGAGIGGLDPERIFRPFTKTAGRSRPGIGLAICRRIARLHGGDITAIPAAAGGVEFLLRLPK